MISLPHIIEPPDLVLVEVMEALPGRPISGERLVRPDGTISLGFYGDVQVRGLTIEQVKVKILKHLRTYLTRRGPGLIEIKVEEPASPPLTDTAEPAARCPGRRGSCRSRERGRAKSEPKTPRRPHPAVRPGTVRRARAAIACGSPAGESPTAGETAGGRRPTSRSRPAPEEPEKPIRIPLDAGGQITITIEIQAAGGETEGVTGPRA